MKGRENLQKLTYYIKGEIQMELNPALKPKRDPGSRRAKYAFKIKQWYITTETEDFLPDQEFRAILMLVDDDEKSVIVEDSPEEFRRFARDILRLLPSDFETEPHPGDTGIETSPDQG